MSCYSIHEFTKTLNHDSDYQVLTKLCSHIGETLMIAVNKDLQQRLAVSDLGTASSGTFNPSWSLWMLIQFVNTPSQCHLCPWRNIYHCQQHWFYPTFWWHSWRTTHVICTPRRLGSLVCSHVHYICVLMFSSFSIITLESLPVEAAHAGILMLMTDYCVLELIVCRDLNVLWTFSVHLCNVCVMVVLNADLWWFQICAVLLISDFYGNYSSVSEPPGWGEWKERGMTCRGI